MTTVQAKLAAAFRDECRDCVEKLRMLLDDPQGREEMARLASNLRGAATAAGQAGPAELARKLEQLVADPDRGDEVRPVLDQLEPREPRADDLQQKLLAAFEIERGDHVAYLREALTTPGRDIKEVYRRVHSLKGAARACGLADIEDIAKTLEAEVGRVRDGHSPWTDTLTAKLRRGVDTFDPQAEPQPEPAPKPDPADELQERVRAAFAVEQAEHVERIRATLANDAPTEDDIADMFRRAHSLKGAARACGFTAIENAAHKLEDLYAQVRDGAAQLDAARAGQLLDAIEDRETASPKPQRELETMRVSAERFDKVLDAAGQLLTECLQKDRLSDDLRTLHKQAEEVFARADSVRRQLGERERRQLDVLASGARNLARRMRDTERRQRHSSWTLTRLGHHLQGEVRKARMTPAASVFQGLRKMMRDLAKETGKQVDFKVTGLQVQADRMVLQALKDPILHMLRNALSHGIEMPAERVRTGKPETGAIELRIEVDGNRLLVTVTDDGRGLGRARSAAGDEDVTQAIFQPGFSTADGVTNLSGRGMGLSVVEEAVTRLQGEVTVLTPELGTSIALSAPLAVSTYRMLLVGCSGHEYALPFSGVERLLRVRAHEVTEVDGRATVEYRGELLPLVPLAQLLGLPTRATRDDVLSLVVLRASGRRCAVAVDAVLGERDALLKDLDGPAAALRHLAGAILREDGAVSLVLQPSELVRTDRTVHSARVIETEKTGRHRILVVDDSFTTRTLERSILETHGFEVEVAVDGIEALEKLRSTKYDMVISDIEMPRLDGFGLVREMKAAEQLAAVPVIVVTSLNRNEDRLRGLELGADAYIVKQRFDHEELLRTIGQILG